MAYETLIVEAHDAVALIRLNRPEALNALNSRLLEELGQALDAAEADAGVRCLVLTGSERAFAAGADIKEMSDKSYAEMFAADFFGPAARRIEACRKPIIAAVSGYALGGGCELAMLCDFIIASETAKFGQPEINLGDRLVAEALEAAGKIAAQSPLAVMMNIELVDAAYETTLSAGVSMERRLFHSLFAFEDQKEGMAAFIEKRKPDFRGR